MAKEKRHKKRRLGNLIREFSAGGVVFRRKGGIECIIINPAKSKRWQLPKGNIDPGEKSAQAAVREIFEETGVKTEIRQKIDAVRFFYKRLGKMVFKTVIFFLMESQGEETYISPEWRHEIKEAVWLPVNEAIERLTFKKEKEIVQKGVELLEK